ncbi:MAG: DUF1588 domain-containing protein [Deltaproteobacteria bacterium]|nr:DUF1588 domain-containing protein [Deltaproteobacteria bacterium]
MTAESKFIMVSFVAFFAACTGSIDTAGTADGDHGSGQGGSQGGGQGTGGSGSVGDVPAGACSLPSGSIRQLTPSQIEASLTKLVPNISAAELDLPRYGRGGNGFTNDSERKLLSLDDVQRLYTSLSKVADKAAQSPAALAGCLTTADETCVRGFVTTFATRAFRRPVTNEERDELVAFWKSSKAADPATALALLLRRVFMAPQFLFRTELGKASSAGVAELTPHEKASALAFTISNAPPDDELIADANSGALSDPSRLASHAERLLSKPETATGLLNMFEELFRVDGVVNVSKDDIFKGWSPAIAADMASEARAFLKELLWQDNGTIEGLLTAPYTVVNGRLASFYGLTGKTESDTKFTRVSVGDQPRAGILGQGALLSLLSHANQNDIVKRGRFVRELLLCEALPDPPASVKAIPPPPQGDLTLRQRIEQHSKDPSCLGCHRLMDPIGAAFEQFDAVGRFRDKDEGKPIDARGEIVDSKASDGSFTGLKGLGQHLAKSAQVRACLARATFRYTLGRADVTEDACQLSELDASVERSGGNLKKLFVQMIANPSFSKRVASKGEQP